MKPKNCAPIMSFVFAFTMTALALLTLLTTPTLAGSGLPPRDTPSPVKPPGGDDKTDRDGPIGTYIELRLAGASAAVWTVVQWQDSAGNWYDVEGWQGTPDPDGGKRWWVAAKDFGTGPFHWVVKQGPGGPVLGMSVPFNLPGGADEIVQVTVLLE